jgi:hypothetical protein
LLKVSDYVADGLQAWQKMALPFLTGLIIQSENLCREFYEFSRIGKGIRVNWRN